MAPLTDCFAEVLEIQRLSSLLPTEMQAQVSITCSMAVNPRLIATERTRNHQFSIQIDLICWQELTVNQRDLLLWHEVARIQAKTVPQFSWEMPVMLTGLAFSLVEICAQNVISLAAALVAVALSAHQLYQQNCGERSLREAVTADRTAIYLAQQFDYSFSEAAASLYSALKWLAKSAQKSDWQKYQVRLRALEILATERDKRSQLHHEDLALSWQS